MSKDQKQTGRCLCGAVTFEVAEPVNEVGTCHCHMCLRWGGGPFFALHAKGAVTFEGEAHMVRYRSSEWAERCFCGTCGTHLLYYLIPTGDFIVSAGALDDTSPLELTSQVFIEEKPRWYALANKTAELTGEQLFAMFDPGDGKS